MKSESSHVLIFSVFQPDKSRHENLVNHAKVKDLLTKSGVKFIPCAGWYQRKAELSFIVLVEHRNLVQTLCRDYNQACYLEHHKDRSCEAVFQEGKRVKLGMMTEVSQKTAEEAESCTKTPDGRYFTTL
jgi:hypothetical protein